MKLVIDTNKIVSAAIRDRVPEKVLLWIVQQPWIIWIISKDILYEYTEVINRPKFRLSHEQKDEWLNLIIKSSIMINPTENISFNRDILDEKFINCAITSKADFIISGDKDFSEVEKLFRIQVISVIDFYKKFIA